MMSSWAVETSRSTADWASSGSAIMVSHSSGVAVGGHDGGGLLVAFDAPARRSRWCCTGFERLEGQVVDDEQLGGGQAAHLVVQGVVQPGGT